MQTIALVGNPNTGKTTLFNSITNQNEHVGNWHGVTVAEKQSKIVFNGKELNIVDLPGTYSLNSFSFEEEVTKDFIKSRDCTILNICDANNLKRNLYLTLELITQNFKPILVLNMANELKKNGTSINTKQLEEELGVRVYLINAGNKNDVNKLLNNIMQINQSQEKNIEDDNNSKKSLKIEQLITYEKQLSCNKTLNNEDIFEKIAQKRYETINYIAQNCIKKSNDKIYGFGKLDKILLNKYLALPIFLIIIAFIFYLTFNSVGKMLSEGLEYVVSNFLFNPIIKFISTLTANEFVLKLIEEGVLGGIASVITFLPQVVILFLFLNILESCGYLSRLAFTLEDIFSKVGLSGKSVFALLMGFGCSTTASLTARTMEDKNSKIKTAMLTPYISCSAKLPLYIVICGAYFKLNSTLIIFSIYILGVLISLLVSYILEKTILPSKTNSFIMEFPALRIPKIKELAKLALLDVKNFFVRVGTVILTFSCIIWIAQNCTFSLKFITSDNQKSILETIGSWVSVILKPIGLNSFGVASALICGVVAKEIIVSTLKIINNVGENATSSKLSESFTNSSSPVYFSPQSSLSFLVFSSMYLPCVSTIGVLRREIGLKWTIFACLLELTISYVLAFVVYKISYLYFEKGLACCLLSMFSFLIFLFSIIFVIRFFKNKNKCKYCLNSKKCNKKCNIA